MEPHSLRKIPEEEDEVTLTDRIHRLEKDGANGKYDGQIGYWEPVSLGKIRQRMQRADRHKKNFCWDCLLHQK